MHKFLPIMLLTCAFAAVQSQSVIFFENFETFTSGTPGTLQNGWTNGTGDDFDWYVNNGATISVGTGPDMDHTRGNSSGKYMFIESSSPNFPYKTALFLSPFIDVSTTNELVLEFCYHMYGLTTGKLFVEVSSGSSWYLLDVISGQKQEAGTAPWYRKRINLPTGIDSLQLRFRGVTSTSFTSDIAIDDVRIYDITSTLAGRITYGGSSDEVGNAIVQAPDGGYLIAGSTVSYGSGNKDVYLVKTDGLGLRLWSKTFGGSGSDEAFSVRYTKDGGIIMGGRTSSYGAGSSDVYLLKTDASGNLIWNKTYGGAGADFGNSLEETADGGFIIGGYKDAGTQFATYVIRTDSMGDTLWTRTIEESTKDWGFSIKQVKDGGFIVVGYRNNTFQASVSKVSATGALEWSQTLDGPGTETFRDILQAPDGGYFLAGGTTSYGQGNADIHLVKIDDIGNLQWAKVYGGPGWDYAYNIQLTNDEKLILTGRDGSFGAGNGDSFIMKLDILGNVIWYNTYGGSAGEWAYAVVPCTDGGYAMTGYTESFGAGGKDMVLVKTDAFGNVGCNAGPAPVLTMASGTSVTVRSPVMVAGSQVTVPGSATSGISDNMTAVCDLENAEGLDTVTFQIALGGLQKEFAGNDDLMESAVQQTRDGGYIVLGTSRSFGVGSENYYLVKFNGYGGQEWSKSYGGDAMDAGYSVRQTDDNGYILAGWTASFGSGNKDVYLVKTNESGDTLWTKTYGGPGDDRGFSVRQTSDGGYIVTGYTLSYGSGAYVIKTDNAGDTLWTRIVTVGTMSSGYSVEQTPDGGYIVGGYSDVCADKTPLAIKLDPDGTVAWVKTYEGSCGAGNSDVCYAVRPTPDGGYIMAGESKSFGPSNADGFLIRLNEVGDTLWSRAYGGSGNDRIHGIVQTADGGFALSGYTTSFGGSDNDAYLIKTNGSGTLEWSKTYGGNASDKAFSIQSSTDGGYIMTGITNSFDIGNQDIYLIKTDASGRAGNCFQTDASTATAYANVNVTTQPIVYATGNLSVNPPTVVTTALLNAAQLDIQTAILTTPVDCNGGNDGMADLTVSGGTDPLTFSWSNGAGTEDIFTLSAGTYTVSVTDFNGCTVVDTAGIGEPPLLLTGVSGTDVSCFGGNDGSATAWPSGGVAPYNYMWNTGQTNATAIGLFPGNYSVNVFDVNGCLANNIITITQPASPVTTISGTDITCFGGSTGAADLTVTGGTMPYTYAWSNLATTQDLSGLLAGVYRVTVTDSCGITLTDSINIVEPPALSTAITATQITCSGAGNGAADLTVSGGAPPYTYSWSNTLSSQDISALDTGQYSVIVTDACTLSVYDTVLITQPPALTVALSKTDVSCNGGVDGTATATPSGGTPPYNYLWNIGQTTSTAIGLFAGNYTVSLSDANGCPASNSIAVNQPNPFSGFITGTTDVSCNGGNDGAVNFSVNSGTMPYTFLWSNTASSQNISAIAAGTYTITATDACGAVITDSAAVDEPPGMSGIIVATDASCNGYADGIADLSVSGGTQPYTYSWASGQVTQDISNLDTGTYVVTITDACAAQLVDTAVISEPQVLTTSMTSTDVDCFGGGNGTGTASVSGGTPPYYYLWNSGQTNATAVGLFPNTYTVNVTDINGCLTTDIVTISQPSQLSASFATTDVSCLVGNDGTATASPSGGTSPYTYLWSPTGDTTSVSTGLAEGIYSVTVSDSCGAAVIASVVVGGPGSLSANLSGTNVTCNGFGDASIDLAVSSGSPPYSYLWSTGDTTEDISGLPAGTYSVTVTDSCGTVVSDSLTITEPPQLTASVTGTNINCNGVGDGTATVTPAGGTQPYFYQWSNNQTVPAMIGLFPGNYTVNVTDNNGCLASDIITITEPPAVSISVSVLDASCGNADGSAAAAITGGVSPYLYAWSGGGSSSSETALAGGSYDLTVTDANGCVDSSTVLVPVSAVPQQICMVTVDSTSSMNVVVWEKPTVANVDSFRVYRDVIGVYKHIGSLPYGDQSNFYDSTQGINPNITSYRYKIAVLDVCGNESLLSDYHETVHVQTNKTGGIVDLSWDNYEGFGFGFYRILRDSAGLGIWEAIDSVTSNNNTYTDINPPSATTRYAIEVVHPAGCLANKQKNWNSSKSNTSTTIGMGGNITATTSSTNASFGGCDGTATISPTSGTPAYTYLWGGNTGFQNTQTAVGLCPGTYSVTVTDAAGATYTTSVTVGEDTGTLLSASTTTSPANADTCNGTATVLPAGGIPPYTYQWDGNTNNQTTEIATALCVGTYSVVVTDSAGNKVTVFATVGAIPGIADILEEAIQFKAFPNPFTRETNVSYTLNAERRVVLELFNMLGELIATVESAYQRAGEYRYRINTAAFGLGPGVYRIRLTLDNETAISRQLVSLN